jgi:hypothetical protein
VPISIEKVQQQAPSLVDLAKKAQDAVTKHDLTGVTAKVGLVLDLSISAEHLYKDGTMQEVAEKILAVSTQFDDDGDIDVFFFHNDAWHAGTLDLSDFAGGIDRLRKGASFGGTQYGRAFDAVVAHYFPKKKLFGKKTDLSVPVYIAFLTDGATQDEDHALTAARASSEYPIFFQSIGLGSAGYFTFLRDRLNNHGGKVDNFGFFSTTKMTDLVDEALLDGLLNEFPDALTKMRDAKTLA